MQAPGTLCIKLKITKRAIEGERERLRLCDGSQDCIYTKYILCTLELQGRLIPKVLDSSVAGATEEGSCQKQFVWENSSFFV